MTVTMCNCMANVTKLETKLNKSSITDVGKYEAHYL